MLIAGDADPSQAPSAWRPLLRMRRRPGIARLQFALAGMNAHINRDLPQGIVQVFQTLGGDPTSDRARRQDFDSVNDLLERVEAEVKTEFGWRDRRGGHRRWPGGRRRGDVEGTPIGLDVA